MRKAPILAATVSAICMLMAAYGCGGGSTVELSKAEFVKQANAICIDAQKQMAKSGKGGPDDVVGALTTTLQTEADEIDALGAPSADADQIEAIVESAREVASTIEADEKELAKAGTQMSRAEHLAKAYGLKSCLLA